MQEEKRNTKNNKGGHRKRPQVVTGSLQFPSKQPCFSLWKKAEFDVNQLWQGLVYTGPISLNPLRPNIHT